MATPRQDEILDHTLTALADPTRRSILKRLAQGEARVTKLAAPFAISLNSVSKHIKLLERAGLVERRRIGREHFLKFRPEPLTAVEKWVADQQAFWAAGLKALDDLLQDEDRTRSTRDGSRPRHRKG